MEKATSVISNIIRKWYWHFRIGTLWEYFSGQMTELFGGKIKSMKDNSEKVTSGKILKLRLKGIWTEEFFKAAVVFLYFEEVVLPIFKAWEQEIVFWVQFFARMAVVVMFMWSVIQNIRHNWLIKNGRLVLVRIKHDFSHFGMVSKVSATYYDREREKVWKFSGWHCMYHPFYSQQKHFEREKYVPVLISTNNPKNNFMLVREMILSFSSIYRPLCYITRTVREVNLLEIEGGTGISVDALYR